MPHFGPSELMIILLIVVVLFGGGRIAKLGGELGTGIRAFKASLTPSRDEESVNNQDAT
jgi:sec-independent protein translocase protein TatA